MKKSDIPVLRQLVKTLEQTESKLEEDYNKKDSESFINSKKMMLKIQKQISNMLKMKIKTK
jgi:hypothetical protein